MRFLASEIPTALQDEYRQILKTNPTDGKQYNEGALLLTESQAFSLGLWRAGKQGQHK